MSVSNDLLELTAQLHDFCSGDPLRTMLNTPSPANPQKFEKPGTVQERYLYHVSLTGAQALGWNINLPDEELAAVSGSEIVIWPIWHPTRDISPTLVRRKQRHLCQDPTCGTSMKEVGEGEGFHEV